MKIEVNTYYELFNLLQESPLFKFLKNIQQLNVNKLRRKKNKNSFSSCYIEYMVC